METKHISKELWQGGQYRIFVPRFYENEEKPMWCTVFKGTKEECEKRLADFPDYTKATYEEEKEMRKDRLAEYLFCTENKFRKKDMQKLKEAYGF